MLTYSMLMISADLPDVPPELPAQLRALLMAIAVRDRGTYSHMRQVAFLVDRLSDWLGLRELERCEVTVAAMVHDIGKLGVPEAILLKSGRLSEREMRELATHAELGASMLLRVGTEEEVARAVLHHHEYFDGGGYPRGLRGSEIPLGSRLIAVADAYDSMTSPRSYRPGLHSNIAVTEINRCIGTQFDPDVAGAFIEMLKAAQADEEQWAIRPGSDPAATAGPTLALRLGGVRRLRMVADGAKGEVHTG